MEARREGDLRRRDVVHALRPADSRHDAPLALSCSFGADPTRDYEYTDWNAVDEFARTFIAEAQTRVA